MPSFSGGVSEHDNGGYLRIMAGPLRKKYVHVLVAEAKLGRKLRRDEHVHHKDGDTRNPAPDNLLVIGEAVHGAVSARQYWYLKQKFSREEAAWRAFLDVTGKSYDEYEDASFDPALLENPPVAAGL
jgi:hypothetical protein